MFELSKLVPQPGVFGTTAPQNCDDLVVAARDHLRVTMHARDAASAVVADRQGAVDRVQALIRQADEAEQALDAAEEQSASFTRDWAEAGASPSEPAISMKLKSAVTASAAAAHTARIASDGAATGLPVTEAMLADATRELEMCQSGVNGAVAQVLAAMIEDSLLRAAQAGQEFMAAADEVQTVVRVLSGHWYSFSSDALANELLHRLRDLAPAPLPARATDLLTREGESFIEAGRQFVDLGNRLLTDPDANQ